MHHADTVMSDFEVMRYLTIGQYMPTGSVLHRLDPRVKLLALVLIVATAMAQKRIQILAAVLLGVLALFVIAKINLKYALRSLVPLLPLFGFVLILQLLFYPQQQALQAGNPILLHWKGIIISWSSMITVGTMALRMVIIVLLLSLFTSLVDVSDLTHGVDGLLRPFQRLGLPAHEVALILLVAFRFVPMLGQELERLLKAQTARGGEFSRGWGLKRIRQTFPLFIPLFVSALRRAEELAVAMEARGYAGGRGRTRLITLRMRLSDWISLILVLCICVSSFII
jgi:energy-coupling factor transport system permease protein